MLMEPWDPRYTSTGPSFFIPLKARSSDHSGSPRVDVFESVFGRLQQRYPALAPPLLQLPDCCRAAASGLDTPSKVSIRPG